MSATQRSIYTLDGEWELLTVKGSLDVRQTKTARGWEKVQVPHFLWARENLHRAWYKCTFAGFEAFRMTIAFESVNFRCVVYVNNQFAGEHTGGYLPFEIDITEYVKDTNELLVGVEDVSAVLTEGKIPDLVEGAPDSILYPVGSGFHIFGLWQSIYIKTYPSVCIEDIFVKTSYRTQSIELDITVTNLDTAEKTLKIDNQILNEFSFPEEEIVVNPSETKTISIKREWKNPLLWSPETPHLYYVETSLVDGEKIIDSVKTRFGFREFWIENGQFVLNGVPLHLRGSSKHLLGDPWTGDHRKDAEETIKRVKAVHSNALRLHANPYPEVFLDTADEQGILIIDESALWCLSDQYRLGEDEFWINAQEHTETLVKRDRNHPSLVIWSVENEILLCGGNRVERCESELVSLGDIIKGLDPTRPIMYEGDYDLVNADIINLHYPHEYPQWNVFPNEAYFLDRKSVIASYPREEFLWDRKKPLYIGEFLWIPPLSPHPHTIFYGNEAFTNSEVYRNKAKAEAWKMYIEAFRSQGVNGYCPWNVLEGGDYPTPLSEALDQVFEPFFGFIKEYDTRFYSGQPVKRTLVMCNDTHEQAQVGVRWSIGQESGEKTLILEPADYTEVTINFTAPSIDVETSFEFSVTMMCNSHVHEIRKEYEVFPWKLLNITGRIALYDPVGETKKILDENSIAYELVDTLVVPSDYDLLIIGYHALKDPPIPTVGGPGVLDFQGNILCFEQETLSLFGLSVTDHDSTIVFERVPVFNLDENDLRFWRGDNLVSRKDIAKATGYIPLMDSGGSGGLEYTPLLEYHHGKGNILFCQVLVTEKYGTEPMAQYLFQVLVDYALDLRGFPRTLGVVGKSEFLDSLNVKYEKTHTFDYDILLITEEVDPEELGSFVFNGGIAWLHGLEPEYIAKIVDVKFEKVNYDDLPVLLLDTELTRGLTNQEFYWTGERVGWWLPFSTDIASYFISGSGTPLTSPCVLMKVNYGKGFYIVDTIQWEYNTMQSARIVSMLLTNLGILMNPSALTIQAEAMDIEEVFLGETGEYFYAFYTNGYLGTFIDFQNTGQYIFRVYAWADIAQDKGAILDLMIDRQSVGTLEVTNIGVYTLECFVQEGVHEIGVAFTNDYWNPPSEDRNLYVDRIEISYRQSTHAYFNYFTYFTCFVSFDHFSFFACFAYFLKC